MGHKGGQKFWGKAKYHAITRIEKDNFWARRIHSVLFIIIIVITDFSLTGLDLKVLK